MALKKSINFRGIVVEYRNIANFQQHKTTWNTNIILAWYATKEAKEAWESPLDTRNFTIMWEDIDTYLWFDVLNVDGENHFKKSYEYIKNKKIISTDYEGVQTEEDGEFFDALHV